MSHRQNLNQTLITQALDRAWANPGLVIMLKADL